MAKKSNPVNVVKQIRKATAKKFSAEDKIRIVLEGLRGEIAISELCRKEGISQGLYYKWSKDFMEAGKRRLSGDTLREANTSEVKELKDENRSLKELHCTRQLLIPFLLV